MAEHNETGKIGERIAQKYLISKEYSIIDRNYRTFWGEIDIIAKKHGTLYFFEVKTVSRNLNGVARATKYIDKLPFKPENRVNTHKIKKLEKAIGIYLSNQNDIKWELKIITIRYDGKLKRAVVKMVNL